MEGLLGRAVYTVVILALIMILAILPIWKENRKKELNRKYIQKMAQEHHKGLRYNNTEKASEISNPNKNAPILFVLKGKKGQDNNDSMI